MKFISEANIIFLEAVAICLFIFVTYVVYLRTRIEQRNFIETRYPILRVTVFIVLCAGVLEITRRFANADQVLLAFGTLAGGMLTSAAFWFLFVRRGLDDDRIRYSLILLAALSQLTCLFLFFMWWASDKVTMDEKLHLDGQTLAQMINNAMQVIGVVIAAAMIVVTNLFNARVSDKNARHQIYQTLELQSIELFRFEAAHPELVEAFWFADDGAPLDEKQARQQQLMDYQMKQYVCQMLNLFEMSFRFRKDGIVPAEVFGSWAIWMWELCEEPRFADMWFNSAGLRLNYVPDFRQAMDKGIEIAQDALKLPADQRSAGANARRDAFADALAKQMGGCEVLGQWFEEPSPPRIAALAKTAANPTPA